jgi:multiple sugar transport system substrate-binding protein
VAVGLTLDGKLRLLWIHLQAFLPSYFDASPPSEPEEVAKLLSTWQGYLDTGKIVNDPDNNIFWTDNISNIPYIYFAHKNFFDEDLNIAFNNPRTLELFEYALEGRRANLDARIPAWTQEWYTALGSGQIATTIAGSWFGGFLKSFVDPEGSGKWGVVPIPEDPLQNWGGSFLAIPEQSENKEAASAFIEYVATNADAQNRIFINVDYFGLYARLITRFMKKATLTLPVRRHARCGLILPHRKERSSQHRSIQLLRQHSTLR